MAALCLRGRRCCSGIAARAGISFGAYPERVISLIVPFPAGGPTDIIARIVSGTPEQLAARLASEIPAVKELVSRLGIKPQ